MNTFKWGVIGPGGIAGRFAGGIHVIEDAVIQAVASRSEERARDFAAKWNVPTVYGDYDALIHDPEIDAIYIATPHNFHFEQAKCSLIAGKPVLCEKPLTVNAAQAAELITLSRERKVFLMEALWTRFLPIYQVAKNWIQKGRLGDIQYSENTFCFPLPMNPENRWYNNELAGGALLDLGVYNLSMSQWLYGRQPESFSVDSYVGKTNVDERTSGVLNYGNGVAHAFTCSIMHSAPNHFSVHGTKGTAYFEPWFLDCQKVQVTMNNGETVTESAPYIGTGFECEIIAAMKHIRAGDLECPDIPHADTFATMELMDAIRKRIGLRYQWD